MPVSEKMKTAVKNGSMVRKMFEEGLRLKALHGEEKVFDYSLGNPDLPPPAALKKTLTALIDEDPPGAHAYMPNAGLTGVRAKLAESLQKAIGVEVRPELIVMTVGAAGALNVALKTILDPGDKAVVLAPFFMEYKFYVENHGGQTIVAETDASFRPDPVALAETLTPDVRAVIINSPNNPTGAVYTDQELQGLAEALSEKSRIHGRPIALISDEPYRRLVYGGTSAPSALAAYPATVAVSSFSKDLSIPGERLGYLCVNPNFPQAEEFAAAAALANRILGFVNAPALMQRAAAELVDESVDVGEYARRVESLGSALTKLGYEVVKPQGTFYLFPKSPLADDVAFVELLKKELILAVPGTGFARRGYFRLSLCLSEDKIARSLGGFEKAMAEALRRGQSGRGDKSS
ncbi:MAG: pyridoxal phosphate-dependent aminotransferase [Deltaproteobacteria bacterium]|jgi:aspartate aminotransferase|nr:pyridoxal phosphate-dependent aminotransferase [Deltaproteobacteria bacterium]